MKKIYFAAVLALLIFIICLIFKFYLGFLFALIIFIFPFLWIYAKTLEKFCLTSYVSAENITIGDWLDKQIKIKTKTIKPYWEGLSESEVNFIKKNFKGKILIKAGIPFVPAFFMAFIAFILILRYVMY
jgi:hypothetical protein